MKLELACSFLQFWPSSSSLEMPCGFIKLSQQNFNEGTVQDEIHRSTLHTKIIRGLKLFEHHTIPKFHLLRPTIALLAQRLSLATTNLMYPSNKDGRTGEVPTRQEQRNKEKQANTIFNEVRQFAYVLGARERNFIDSRINYNRITEGYKRDTIHKGSKPYL